MMLFSELIRLRRSIRNYKSDPVSEELLNRILDAGRLAPSACNYQPWHFIVKKGKEQVSALAAAYDRPWFLAAPAVIIVCVDRSCSWKRNDDKDFGDIDAAIAMDHMILQATELGLGTCWIGAFNKDELIKVIDLPDNMEPVIMTPLGFPAKIPEAKPRKQMNEICNVD
jgi:nitroreductase